MNSINLFNGLLIKGETEIINSEMNEVIIPEIQIPEDNKKYLRYLKKILKFTIGGVTIQSLLTKNAYAATRVSDSLLVKSLNTVAMDITEKKLPDVLGKYIFWALGGMAALSCLIQIIQCIAEEDYKGVLPVVFFHIAILLVAMMVIPMFDDLIRVMAPY